jgi:bifunctional DNA-binding transcriptional regulator/antitoxin component of YhaV-PrlF toxin-antitoxin module
MGRETHAMTTLTVTAKGQITLKQDLLEHLGVGPGQKIEVEPLPNGQVVVRAAAKNGAISDFIGCLSNSDGPKLTNAEIGEIAGRGWAKSR